MNPDIIFNYNTQEDIKDLPPLKKIEVFETSDGRIYKTEEEVEFREKLIRFEEWFGINTLYSSDDCNDYERVQCSVLFDWLNENMDELKILIK